MSNLQNLKSSNHRVQTNNNKKKTLLVSPFGYTYTIRKDNKTTRNWWCSQRRNGCKATATETKGNSSYKVGTIEHNHDGIHLLSNIFLSLSFSTYLYLSLYLPFSLSLYLSLFGRLSNHKFNALSLHFSNIFFYFT